MTLHEMSLERSAGSVRARCSCGWASGWHKDEDQAIEEWDFHFDDVYVEEMRP